MVFKAPNEQKRSHFLARLETLGLYDEMYRIANQFKNDPSIVSVLQTFQINTKQVFLGLQFEAEVHKERVRQLTEHKEALE